MNSSEKLNVLLNAGHPFSTEDARKLGVTSQMIAYFWGYTGTGSNDTRLSYRN